MTQYIRSMGLLLAAVVFMGFTGNGLAMTRPEVEKRIRKLTAKFEAMQAKPEKRVPAELLAKAQGILLLDRTKAGFIFAYQGGSGVGMVRDPKTKKWGPPAFYTATEASLGFQVGGQQSFVVVLMMNTNATRLLTEMDIQVGGEATGTAGRETATAESSVSSLDLEPAMVTYTDREGLYGGAAVKGNALSVDDRASMAYYQDYFTPGEIVRSKKLKTSDAYAELVKTLEAAAKKKE